MELRRTKVKPTKDIDIFTGYIKELVEAAKIDGECFDKKMIFAYGNQQIVFSNAKYLLGQTLRQFCVDENHWHISMKAKKALEEKRVPANYDFLIPYTVNANKTLKPFGKFNSKFMVEHVIPINRIINELFEEETITRDCIIRKLEEIHVCIITGEENESLSKNGFARIREGTFDEIINVGAYHVCEIELAE